MCMLKGFCSQCWVLNLTSSVFTHSTKAVWICQLCDTVTFTCEAAAWGRSLHFRSVTSDLSCRLLSLLSTHTYIYTCTVCVCLCGKVLCGFICVCANIYLTGFQVGRVCWWVSSVCCFTEEEELFQLKVGPKTCHQCVGTVKHQVILIIPSRMQFIHIISVQH